MYFLTMLQISIVRPVNMMGSRMFIMSSTEINCNMTVQAMPASWSAKAGQPN